MKIFKISHLFIFSLFLSSCALYSPQSPTPVLLTEKGQLTASAGTAVYTTETSPELNIDAAYAVSNRLAVKASYSIAYRQPTEGDVSTYVLLNPERKLQTRLFAGYTGGSFRLVQEGAVARRYENAHKVNWDGGYSIPYAGVQINLVNKAGEAYGFSLRNGLFLSDFHREIFPERDFEQAVIPDPELAYIDQKALLLEPSLFYASAVKHKLRFFYNLSIAHFIALDDFSAEQPDKLQFSYFKAFKAGLGVTYYLH